MVASRTRVMPCIETLEWILNHIDADKCLINNVEGQCVGVFLSMEINKYGKLRELEVKLNTDFVVYFYEKHNTGQLLASLWKEDRKFINKPWDGIVPSTSDNLHVFNGFNMSIIWRKGPF
jgi:hypothetical protein